MDLLAWRPARVCADLLCPERCAACPTIVAATQLFCPPCRARVDLLGPPECDRCGTPGLHDADCPTCRAIAAAPVRYARGVAAYRFGGGPSPVAAAIAAFKYHGATRVGRRLAGAMRDRVPDRGVDLVVPVPLHPRKLRARGFNQSALLARYLAASLGRPAGLRVLVRTRDTPSQVTRALPARALNVANAFAVRRVPAVADRAVLLVDDVWTSGATACAAAAALHEAGARNVDVVTFARVLAPVT